MKSRKELPDNPPDYLKGTARYMWRRLVPLIKQDPVVNEMDKTMVEAFCANYQLMRNAYKHIQEEGAVNKAYKTNINPVTGEIINRDFTGFKRNPSTQILDAATNKLKALGNELGLTPQSRAELLALSPDDDDDESISDIINGNGDLDG